MLSLRQLLDRHISLLLVDSSSTRVEAALWQGVASRPVHTVYFDGEASSALPEVTAKLLTDASLRVYDLDAVAFCAGPGSVLGIRLAAASLRTWRALKPSLSLYSYQSLPLLAAAHPDRTIVADARRDNWHVVQPESPGQIQRYSKDQVVDLSRICSLGTPETFRRWSALPAEVAVASLEYSPSALLCGAPDGPFFSASPEPEAFLAETPSYMTWTPQIHQAPSPRPAK